MYFKMSSAVCFNFDQSKILPSGNELSEPLASLITYFQDEFDKFYLNSQRI